jgi:hypothetical protein
MLKIIDLHTKKVLATYTFEGDDKTHILFASASYWKEYQKNIKTWSDKLDNRLLYGL